MYININIKNKSKSKLYTYSHVLYVYTVCFGVVFDYENQSFFLYLIADKKKR